MIDKLSFLKVGQDAGSASAEEERLMQLFQNRAGLKKAYADLKDEFHLLRDRLKQQEGATIRVQEQLDALGELLADPATGFGALVFYQLRALWKTCHQQIAGFASELTKQQEARELARHQEEVEAERSAIDAEAPPPFPGISLGARRNINLAIIGYAEIVCETVDAFQLTARTKEAMARRVHEMTFGSRADCESYMHRVQRAIAAVSNPRQVNSAVKLKMDRLRANSEFRNAADTVPTADSLAYAPNATTGGGRTTAPSTWNVLAEDYWDLYTLLLR